MKGIVFEAPGRAVLHHDLPRPACGAEQLLLRTRWSGVTNGTERNCLMGGNYCPGFPNRAGYQIVGEVVEVGQQVTGYDVGDLVYSGNFVGHVEYSAVTIRNDSLVVRLPENIRLDEVALLGVASVAMHDCRRAQITVGQKVLVVGLGLVGQLVLQQSLALGATVVASDLDLQRRDLAQAQGADLCVDPTTEQGQNALTNYGPFDVILETSGANILPQLIRLVRHRGALVLIAGRSEVVYPFNDGQNKELTILQVGHFEQDDIRQVLRLIQKGVVRLRPLIKDTVSIDDAERIYIIMRDDPAQLFGTIFDWN